MPAEASAKEGFAEAIRNPAGADRYGHLVAKRHVRSVVEARSASQLPSFTPPAVPSLNGSPYPNAGSLGVLGVLGFLGG